MLKKVPTIVIFIIVANSIIICKLIFGFSWVWLQSIIYIYILLAAYGSIFISSQFYIPAICKFKTTKKQIALTFDDGPDEYTLKVLDTLKRYNAKAVFFVIGKKVIENPEIVKRIYDDGHAVGIHSYSHAYMFPLYSVKRIYKEIVDTNNAIFEATGKKTNMFRPPFGVLNPLVAGGVRKAGKVVVGWNIRSLDTVKGDSDSIIAKVKKKLKPGSIVLLHDTTDGIEIALEKLLKFLHNEEYSCVGLHEVIETPWYE